MFNARLRVTPHTLRAQITTAVVLFAMLLAAAVQLSTSADADALTIKSYATARDGGGIDYDRNGTATSTSFGLSSQTLSIGEYPNDGNDLRTFMPFAVTDQMLAAVKSGGVANIALKVSSTANLAGRRVVLDAYTAPQIAASDYSRAATTLTALKPAAGKLGVDVTSFVRDIPAATNLVLRVRLETPAPKDKLKTRVTVWMSEAKLIDNRPVLTVTTTAAAPTAPTIPTTTPTTPAPTAPPTPEPTPTPTTGKWSAAAGTTVGSTTYPVPAGAIIASPTGNDAAAGTEAAPVRTLARAVALAPTGGTVVLRAGSYHESVALNKRLTIQSWPKEAAWLEGSSAVADWAPAGGRWHKDGWNLQFDASPTYTRGAADNTAANWGFVNAGFPMASHPDQIWIDGVAQRQVGALAEVTPGAFFHDEAAHQLWLGTDPTGKDVRASDLVRALMVRADASVIRGLGVRRFAPSVPDMGAVTIERPGVLVENVAITDTSTTGLHVGSGTTGDVTLRSIYLARNGMLGMNANNADRLTIDRMVSEGNNTEHFNTSPVSGGAKIGRTRGVVVRDSVFRGNDGPGLWMDESVYDMTITGNEMRDNAKHGVSLELSAKALLANNIITNNAGYGVKINNTSDVSVWNNTFSGNDRSIFFTQDSRQPTSPDSAGRDKRQPFPDPTMTWRIGPGTVMNNIIANQRTGSCMLCVEDSTQQRSAAQIGVTTNSNVYNRANGAPAALITWSRTGAGPLAYNDLATFRAATGQEAAGQATDGSSLVATAGNLVAAVANTAQPLPAAIAALTGQTAGLLFHGAWPR